MPHDDLPPPSEQLAPTQRHVGSCALCAHPISTRDMRAWIAALEDHIALYHQDQAGYRSIDASSVPPRPQ